MDEKENELAILEFIHAFVLILDQFFENVCELGSLFFAFFFLFSFFPRVLTSSFADIMFNLEKIHYLLDETVTNGTIGFLFLSFFLSLLFSFC